MICLFFRFGQILKFLHLLIARSPKNPMETLATPDGRRQFQGDTHVEWFVELLFSTRRTSDGMRTRCTAPRPGAANSRLCHAPGGAPCLRGDIVLPRRDNLSIHA